MPFQTPQCILVITAMRHCVAQGPRRSRQDRAGIPTVPSEQTAGAARVKVATIRA
jgi:hypothetical protein